MKVSENNIKFFFKEQKDWELNLNDDDLNNNQAIKSKWTDLIGETIIQIKADLYDEEMYIKTKSNFLYSFLHESSCCEWIYLGEIIGDIEDIINTPIINVVIKEDLYDDDNVNKFYQACPDVNYRGDNIEREYHFYEIQTIKGSVIFRFLGVSNGCYATKVDCVLKYNIEDNSL